MEGVEQCAVHTCKIFEMRDINFIQQVRKTVLMIWQVNMSPLSFAMGTIPLLLPIRFVAFSKA